MAGLRLLRDSELVRPPHRVHAVQGTGPAGKYRVCQPAAATLSPCALLAALQKLRGLVRLATAPRVLPL